MNFLLQGFQKLLSDRQTHKQTDTTGIIHYATLRVVRNESGTSLVTCCTLTCQLIMARCRSDLHLGTKPGNRRDPLVDSKPALESVL